MSKLSQGSVELVHSLNAPDSEITMATMSKPLSLLYFFSGLLCGVLVGVSLGERWSGVITKVISAGAIIVIALFWQRIESVAHKRYLETWSIRRSRGKWHFILTEYVLIRGTILFVVTAGPMFPILILTKLTASILLASVVVLALLLMYLGYESWTHCEHDYDVQVLRQAAEQSRIERN